MVFVFESELWEWQGQAAWCFVSVPSDYYDEIRLVSGGQKRGFGSARVQANVGKTTWKTSLFPDSKAKTYLLPVKKAVRKSENLVIGEHVPVSLNLVDI